MPSVLARAAILGARARARALAGVYAADRVVGELLVEALSPDERRAVTIAVYDGSPFYDDTALDGWEAAWFERDLPPAPARVLVGACGTGREVAALVARGYAVDGFDPAATPLALARKRLPGARFADLAYEDVARDGLPAGWGPYDAVLLGAGSFSHLVGDAARRALLAALDRACPEGPLLASFWLDEPEAASRTARAARRVGVVIGRLRRFPADHDACARWEPTAGFYEAYTPDRIEAFAAAIGRTVRWGGPPEAYPHATLVRKAA
jgi:SAM-dependent methyltransferase